MDELLTLVRCAPGSLDTLVGAITTWLHRERIGTVREHLADTFGYDLSSVRPVPPPAAPFGDDGPPGGPFGDGDSAAPPQPAEPEETSSCYVVVDLPERWRIVERGHVEVRDGDREWTGTGTLVTESWGELSPLSEAGVLGICLYPGRLVGGLAFAEPARDELQGRPCWVVDARPRPVDEGASSAALSLSVGRRITEFVGAEHRFWFDATTGIVLRHEGRIDDRLCSTIELTDVVVDGPVGDHEFAAPPGAVVRAPHELLRDHLADMGIDPDTIDLDNPDAVRRALRGAL